MHSIRLIFGLITGIIVTYVFSYLIIGFFEFALFGRLKQLNLGIAQGFLRRCWIYVLIPVIFCYTGTSLILLPNPNLQEVIKNPLALESIRKDSPYSENKIEGLKFPLAKNNLIWGIITTILIISLTRMLTLTYHSFLVRALMYYSLLAIGLFWIILIALPSFHSVVVDYVIRPNFSEFILFIGATGIIGGFTTEFLLQYLRGPTHYTSGKTVSAGAYGCKKCLKTIHIEEDCTKLPQCICGHNDYCRLG